MVADYILQQLFNGIILGSMYALLALGMNMVYGILGLINFAHGAFVMLGAFFFLLVFTIAGFPFWAAMILLILFGVLMGFTYDLIGFKKLRGAGELSLLITSLGVYYFIENLMKIIATPQSYPFSAPEFLTSIYTIGPITFRGVDLFIILTSLTIMLGIEIFIKRSKVGIAMRATSENLEATRLMGINIDRVILIAFVLGMVIAGITGFMWGAKYGSISYNMGFLIGVKAFIAIVIGGRGSVTGSLIGGYILGILEILSIALLPPGFSPYRDGIVFTILIAVLLVRPSGIMGKKEEVRL